MNLYETYMLWANTKQLIKHRQIEYLKVGVFKLLQCMFCLTKVTVLTQQQNTQGVQSTESCPIIV